MIGRFVNWYIKPWKTNPRAAWLIFILSVAGGITLASLIIEHWS